MEPEKNVTPEMALAGAKVLWHVLGDVLPYGSTAALAMATEVFQAMTRCSETDQVEK